MFLWGTPFIFNGEEIGQSNLYNKSIDDFNDIESKVAYKKLLEQGMDKYNALDIINQKSRDNGRSPFSWDETSFFGFSKSTPWIYFSNRNNINLERDLKNDKSIFKYYQEIINLRKHDMIFSNYKISFSNLGDQIFSYKIHGRNNKFYKVIVNLSNETFKMKTKVKSGRIIISNYEIKEDNLEFLLPFQAIIFN